MDEGGVSRRGLLTGVGGTVAGAVLAGLLVERDVLPGRTTAYRVLGLDELDVPMPTTEPGPAESGSFASTARGAETGWVVSYPPGHDAGEALPVLIVLHGASFDHTAAFERVGFDRYLAEWVGSGGLPFALASVDGGPTYWHRQPDGTDSGAMVVEEFLPLLADRGLDTSRAAVAGWSMGGYGGLLLAHQHPGVFASVGCLSPALNPGEPDDLDVLGHPEWFADVPVRIDCGRGDPFYPNVSEFVDRMDPTPTYSFGTGSHGAEYWRSQAPEQLAFAAAHLG